MKKWCIDYVKGECKVLGATSCELAGKHRLCKELIARRCGRYQSSSRTPPPFPGMVTIGYCAVNSARSRRIVFSLTWNSRARFGTVSRRRERRSRISSALRSFAPTSAAAFLLEWRYRNRQTGQPTSGLRKKSEERQKRMQPAAQVA